MPTQEQTNEDLQVTAEVTAPEVAEATPAEYDESYGPLEQFTAPKFVDFGPVEDLTVKVDEARAVVLPHNEVIVDGSMTREEFLHELKRRQELAEAGPPPPVGPTIAQAEATRIEMERGASVSARHAANARPRQPEDPRKEGFTDPVYRPPEHVHGVFSRDQGLRDPRFFNNLGGRTVR